MYVDPRTLKRGDLVTWRPLRPETVVLVTEVTDRAVIGEDMRNVALHGPGGFPPSSFAFDAGLFERVSTRKDQLMETLRDLQKRLIVGVAEGNGGEVAAGVAGDLTELICDLES